MKKFILLLFLFIFLYPGCFPAQAHTDELPEVRSEAAILMDAKSGEVLFEKNTDRKMYPASLTKMVTGIIAIEKGNLADMVSVSEEAAEVIGTSVYLVEGEKVEMKRLVQGLLINSGNDAGAVIAEHMAGNVEHFAEEMNEFVQSTIGINDSHFTNPHGLFDENNYTTAYDMAKIAQYAMENEVFKEIAGTKKLEWEGEGWETTIYNHHKLLREKEEVTGIKNGYIPQSGYTLATTAEKGNVELIAVTLNAPTSQKSYEDTMDLSAYGFENFGTEAIRAKETYTDEEGNQYMLTSDAFVTVPKDDKITKEVKDGSLVIKNDSGKIFLKQKLIPVGSSTKTMKTERSSEKNTDDTQENWFKRLVRILLLPFTDR